MTLARRTPRRSIAAALVLGWTDDPYPAADSVARVLYRPFSEAPKTLNPAVAPTTAAHDINGLVNVSLLEYHCLKCPDALACAGSLTHPELHAALW